MTRKSTLGAALTASAVLLLAPAPAASAATRAPVLGARHAFVRGSGVVAPRLVDAAGVQASVINAITWQHWGRRTAIGTGRKYQYTPNGGYYPREVKVQLRATRLGRCRAAGRRTYRLLRVRAQTKPGGAFGNWYTFGGTNLCR